MRIPTAFLARARRAPSTRTLAQHLHRGITAQALQGFAPATSASRLPGRGRGFLTSSIHSVRRSAAEAVPAAPSAAGEKEGFSKDHETIAEATRVVEPKLTPAAAEDLQQKKAEQQSDLGDTTKVVLVVSVLL